VKLDAADVELVRGRRVAADELEERPALGGEERDRPHEQEDWNERPEPPAGERASLALCDGAGLHYFSP
jgi:hypothetical protein